MGLLGGESGDTTRNIRGCPRASRKTREQRAEGVYDEKNAWTSKTRSRNLSRRRRSVLKTASIEEDTAQGVTANGGRLGIRGVKRTSIDKVGGDGGGLIMKDSPKNFQN